MELDYRKSVIRQSVGGEETETEVMLPDLALEQESRPVGVWGQRHGRYLKEHRKAAYTSLLTSGRLNGYLADIDEQAQEMLSRLVKELADKEGITEKLKAENALKWVQAMNNIRSRAEEVVYSELIYN